MADSQIDVWVRGTGQTSTVALPALPPDPHAWTDDDVGRLLEGMLRAIDRTRNPEGDDPPVTLRGFSWIVEPTEAGVVVALEMPMGAAVAGPFAIDEPALTAVIRRLMAAPPPASSGPSVH